MCGIAGMVSTVEKVIETVVCRMVNELAHRGPDDNGVWVDHQNVVGLGHRRLSILDLSAAGHQPMHSVCGRFVLVFNGEIYNHLEIRKQLESGGVLIQWRGHSDSETLLEAFAVWGVEKTLKACVGMFAIALWDKQEDVLTLARDRMGEKPLYYGWQGDTFMFGSELKALKAHPDFKANIDRQALTLFLRYNYIPSPYSIYQGINKLPAGTFLQIQFERDKSSSHQVNANGREYPLGDKSQPIAYWSLKEMADRGQVDPFSGSDEEALALLEGQLGDAIAGQQLADVPLGAFLSGGIDSSVVTALMQARSEKPIKTFTIGFDESGYNEAEHAKAVAKHLGTEHTELYVSARDALDVIPRLPSLYDEPFADSSQIPTFLVAQMAKQHVTVALSGDGGDELFGGYNRHTWSRTIHQKTSWLPISVRQGIGAAMCAVSPGSWDSFNQRCGSFLPSRFQTVQMGEKVHKMAGLLTAKDGSDMYRRLVSQWFDPAGLVIGGAEPNHQMEVDSIEGIEHQMMLMDGLTYLPDDILCKVDRAAMGVSLETRVPMLDHRVVELAWSLPLHMKIRNGQGKWLLRELLFQHVPRKLIERPKQGFGLPVGDWLRGPLRDWAEILLDASRLQQEGYFKVEPIRQAWKEHLNGKNKEQKLWGILMFQAWLEKNK